MDCPQEHWSRIFKSARIASYQAVGADNPVVKQACPRSRGSPAAPLCRASTRFRYQDSNRVPVYIERNIINEDSCMFTQAYFGSL